MTRTGHASLESLISAETVVGVVAGRVDSTGLSWCAAAGRSVADTGVIPDKHTIFRIGSISKTFTATAVAQLAARGILDLDDALTRWVPEAGAISDPFGALHRITLRHVLTHRSGLPGEAALRYWANLKFPSTDELLASLPRTDLCAPPRSAFKYSNLGFALLGIVVERATGAAFEEWLKAELLQPLQLDSTGFSPVNADRTAAGYGGLRTGAGWAAAPVPDHRAFAPAGQMWSTADDLARWLAHLLADARDRADPVPGAARRELFRVHDVDATWTSGQALGWMARRHGEHVTYHHGGAVLGFQSHVELDLAAGTGAVILTNTMAHAGMETALSAVRNVTEQTSADLKASAEVGTSAPGQSAGDVNPFTGRYRWLDAFDAEVHQQQTGLHLYAPLVSGAPRPEGNRLEPLAAHCRFGVTTGRYMGESIAFDIDDPGNRAQALELPGGAVLRRLS